MVGVALPLRQYQQAVACHVRHNDAEVRDYVADHQRGQNFALLSYRQA